MPGLWEPAGAMWKKGQFSVAGSPLPINDGSIELLGSQQGKRVRSLTTDLTICYD
jgi:hypothetical protein